MPDLVGTQIVGFLTQRLKSVCFNAGVFVLTGPCCGDNDDDDAADDDNDAVLTDCRGSEWCLDEWNGYACSTRDYQKLCGLFS